MAILSAKKVTKRFGGLVAVGDLDCRDQRTQHPQHHRTQWCWQDDLFQLHHRFLPS